MVWARIGSARAHYGITWARSLVVRGHFSLNPGPSTGSVQALGQARPCGIAAASDGCWFRCWAAWPILRLRGHGHGRWPARSGPVVRLVQRAVLCEVGEDGADGVGFFDAGHDPYRTAAVDAGAHVDAEHALETLRLSHRTAAFVGMRGSAGSGGVSWVAFDGSRLPRPEGVNCARRFAFGAQIRLERI